MVPNTPAGVADETIRFYNLLKEGGVRVVMLNTGEVGFGDEAGGRKPVKIPKPVSEKVIAEFVKGELTFRESQLIHGLLVPEGMDEFNPENPEVIDKETLAKRFPAAVREKRRHMEKYEPYFNGDERKIVDAFYNAFKAE